MYRKRGEPPTSGTSKLATGEPAPDDGQEGGWTRQQLRKMDQKFRQRVERAFGTGPKRGRGRLLQTRRGRARACACRSRSMMLAPHG